MSRPSRARALLPLTLVVAAACQDYNFNPVGHCMVQPGTERVTLSNISTADVLFVVDDSGSMGAEQAKLAANFSRFVSNLDATNTARVAKGLQPIDFHLAVTTTSVFWNYGPSVNATCSSSCGSATGSKVCCASGAPVMRPIRCSGAGASCPGGATCSATCQRLAGEYFCCDGATGTPVAAAEEPLSCALEGQPCGGLDHHYQFNAACTAGVSADNFRYPQGDFVSWSSGATVNPRILHFDKELYPATPTPGVTPTNRQGFTAAQLTAAFVGGTGAGGAAVQGNVIVGTCGSGQEQGLQAARLAVQKALAKQQKDTWTAGAGSVVAWDPTNRVASAGAEWPHDNAKLVLVFIGDEDDCSSPDDASGGIVMGPEAPGADACVRDTTLPAAQQKEYQVQEFVNYFASLGRPLAAAFIESAATTVCGRSLASGETVASLSPGDYSTTCSAGVCCQTDCPGYANVCGPTAAPAYCGGQAGGYRFFAVANALRAQTIAGANPDVLQGSVCDPNFGELLNQIAEILKPPAGLKLPSQPASGDIVLLRIARTNGQTRRICNGPAPAGTSGAALDAYDWWFTATKDPGAPVAVSEFVYINHNTGNCEANPGETYSADYIAQTPAAGCATRADCAAALGGAQTDWGCYTPPGATVPVGATYAGTCICCSAGSTDPACQ